ncbi:unnamed protein product [Cylicocyclus nassatus]|uniref:Uncharacterized protein n=1 Tax=Cylicocyclus nassatus TaxID=53992 RepID=A0AA36M5E0_CYLNA|nr:unnamed protein product [Cylicocyclus nassatus]
MMMSSMCYDPNFGQHNVEDRKRAAGDESARENIAKACGCISYEVIVSVVGMISIIVLVVPVILDEGTETIYASLGVKIIWCGVFIPGIIRKSQTCMVCCMICNIFVVVFAIYHNFYWEGMQTIFNYYHYVIPAVLVEVCLCVLTDNIRVVYTINDVTVNEEDS